MAADLQGATLPKGDGDINDYVDREAAQSAYFDRNRKVIFINGMANTPEDHTVSALALSLVQMCAVIGVYNQSVSGWQDFLQCIGDKNQFNGPLSLSSRGAVAIRQLVAGMSSAEAARSALQRNPAQVRLFDLLRLPENVGREIFAHSQGNLILSNVLQAIYAVDGAVGLTGRVVHTFGSPAVTWPPGIKKYEHGFTFDPVTFLAGFDTSFSISKVGMPAESYNPITHAFLEYLKVDAAFIINRFRIGGWGMTLNMDEDGLAKCLAAMGTNMERVRKIFQHLKKNHNTDSDDVAVRYIELIKDKPAIVAVLKTDGILRELLVTVLTTGIVFERERKAADFVKAL